MDEEEWSVFGYGPDQTGWNYVFMVTLAYVPLEVLVEEHDDTIYFYAKLEAL